VGAGLGVERQEQDCRALAERLGLPIGAVLVDNDLSAYNSRKPRPAYQQLIEGVKAGAVTAVIAWHPDRLHRSPRELEQFIDIIEAAGIPVHTVTAGDVDLSTAHGRMTARIVGAVARHESEHKSERNRRKHLELAEKGLPSGGQRRYGYELDGVTVREGEAQVVREIARRVISGDSLSRIAHDLNDHGTVSARGGPWTPAMVRQTVLRPRNAALRVYSGQVFGKAVWPPLITEETWAIVRALLQDPARRTITTNARKHLLSGIARCGVCGTGMRVSWRDDRQLYQCMSRQACVTRRLAPVDEMVTEAVIARLSAAPSLVRAPETSGRDFEAENAVLRGRMKDAAKLFARGAIDVGTLEDIRSDIDRQLDLLTDQAVSAVPVGADLAGAPDVRARWAELSLQRKRAVIAALFEIRVLRTGRGARFDPSSIELTPR
jgi:site-specific DNA recombinase